MCLIVPYYYYKKTEDEINFIMKIKGAFTKVVSLNKVVKHPLIYSNQTLILEFYFIHFRFFNIHIIQ
jgi:hypothetical protein